MVRYRILVEFDGSAYAGWQSQKNADTVQDALARAIACLSGVSTRPIGAGRTDAGVHALALPAHFDLPHECAKPAHEVQNALNHHLRRNGESISVHGATQADESFHARHDAIRRHYLYRIASQSAPPALHARRVLHLRNTLALGQMKKASAALIGTHDFSSFRAAGCQAASALRSLESIKIEKVASEFSFSEEVAIRIAAPSFLYHQVRIIVGTLILVGLERWPPEQVAHALAARSRAAAGPTAPAHGLYFVRADYPDSRF